MNYNALQGLTLDVLNWLAKQDWSGKYSIEQIESAFNPNVARWRINHAISELQDMGYIIFNGETCRLTASCVAFLKEGEQ